MTMNMTMDNNVNTLVLSATKPIPQKTHQSLTYEDYDFKPFNLKQSYDLLLNKQVTKYEYVNLTINEIEFELNEQKNIPVGLLQTFSDQVKDVNLTNLLGTVKKFDGKRENLSELLYLIRLYGVIKASEKKFQALRLTSFQHVN